MKKTVSILRLREISLTDLLLHLLRHWWVILLIALASAMTAYSAAGTVFPTQYSDSITLSVRSTANTEKWSDQFNASVSAASTLINAINNKAVSTDFATNELEKKLNVTVHASSAFADQSSSTAQNTAPSNLITVSATAATPDEVYLYLTSLADHADELVARANLSGLSIVSVTDPTVSSVEADASARLTVAVAVALGAGVLACLLLAVIRLFDCAPATRSAAERLLVLPIAGALNKGGRGRTTDACLPLPSSEKANGSYVGNLAETAAFLLGGADGENARGKTKYLQVVPLSSEAKGLKESEKAADWQSARRIAFNLALAMTDRGARVCLADETGEALETLGIEPKADTSVYPCNERLTVCVSDIGSVQADGYDKVISALPAQSGCCAHEDYHTLWCLPSGVFTAEQINAMTAPSEGNRDTASLVLYGLHTARDAKPAKGGSDGEDELDLLRWAAASLKAIYRIRIGWTVLFALATVTALALGIGMRLTNYRTQTAFSLATADVTLPYTQEQLEAMSSEDARTLMAEWVDPETLGEPEIKGNALYPTARAIDTDLLMTEMTALWNSELMKDAVGHYLNLTEAPDFSVEESNEIFTLTVHSDNREETETVTRAFFKVAPSVSAYAAGGLTFFADEPQTSAADVSLMRFLPIAWIAVILAGIAYALTAGYFDRSLYCGYEVQETLGAPVVGKCRSARLPASEEIDPSTADVGLARFIRSFAEQTDRQRVLMITSALRSEKTTELTRTVEALLRQNGLKVKTVDRANGEKLSESADGCDVLLLDCPGMAVDSDLPPLAEKADGILWAVRYGFADRERLNAAVGRLKESAHLLGCVWTLGSD